MELQLNSYSIKHNTTHTPVSVDILSIPKGASLGATTPFELVVGLGCVVLGPVLEIVAVGESELEDASEPVVVRLPPSPRNT